MLHEPVVVLVDTEPALIDEFRALVGRLGLRVVAVAPGPAAAQAVRDLQPTVAFVRVDAVSAEALRQAVASIMDVQPRCRVVALAPGWPPVEAQDVLASSVFAVVTVPLDARRIEQLLASAAEDRDRRFRVLDLDARLAQGTACAGMLGRGARMQAVFEHARRVAPHLHAAWIVGEPGVGKRRLARALHAIGPRRERPFFVLECGDGDTTALEARVFGTTMSGGGPGVLGLGDGGVVYFDDIARLPESIQERLVPVLERGAWFDGKESRRTDLLVLAGALRSPAQLVEAGHLRPDLRARLGPVEFHLPPLRERREDILPMAAAFLREAAARLGRPVRGLMPEAEALLLEARWPGNVRQLKDVIERVCLATASDLVLAQDVAAAMPPAARGDVFDEDAEEVGRPLSSVEREHILRALQRAGGNKKAAARMLGVSRRALYRKLERLDLASTITRRERTSQAADRTTPASARVPDATPMPASPRAD